MTTNLKLERALVAAVARSDQDEIHRVLGSPAHDLAAYLMLMGQVNATLERDGVAVSDRESILLELLAALIDVSACKPGDSEQRRIAVLRVQRAFSWHSDPIGTDPAEADR